MNVSKLYPSYFYGPSRGSLCITTKGPGDSSRGRGTQDGLVRRVCLFQCRVFYQVSLYPYFISIYE